MAGRSMKPLPDLSKPVQLCPPSNLNHVTFKSNAATIKLFERIRGILPELNQLMFSHMDSRVQEELDVTAVLDSSA
ncbi:hypothetical protein BGZ83_010068, partial [Gryganskiella cystojenkinii]